MRLTRQNKILEIIKTHEVETQDQLLTLLREAGYSVTQATVSRDIRELQLIKVSDGPGKSRYSVIQMDMAPLHKKYNCFYNHIHYTTFNDK